VAEKMILKELPSNIPPGMEQSNVRAELTNQALLAPKILGPKDRPGAIQESAAGIPVIRRIDGIRSSVKRAQFNLAMNRPTPSSSSDSGKGSGRSGNGNDGNGRGGRKKGSGEHPAVNEGMEKMLPPTPLVLQAAALLEVRHGIKVNTPDLYPTSQRQQEYRERLLGPAMQAMIWKVKHRDALPAEDREEVADLQTVLDTLIPQERVKQFYTDLGGADLYKGGAITDNNLGVMFEKKENELMDLIWSIQNGQLVRKRNYEIAPGNGEYSRTLMDLRDKYAGLAHFRHGLPGKGPVTRERIRLLYNGAVENTLNLPKTVDPYITAIDIAPTFVARLRKKNINGVQADISDAPEKIFSASGLEPNSADSTTSVASLDRVGKFLAMVDMWKLLAKKDGSTQFLIGFYVPFSPKMKAFLDLKNEHVPEFECFDDENDLRKGWIGLSPAETIYKIVKDLNMLGFNTKNLAEHEYEVYGPHCICEKATVLRTDPKFAFLKNYDWRDDKLNAKRDAVFSGEIPDDEIVTFPERVPIILISGNIPVALDGSKYEIFSKDSQKMRELRAFLRDAFGIDVEDVDKNWKLVEPLTELTVEDLANHHPEYAETDFYRSLHENFMDTLKWICKKRANDQQPAGVEANATAIPADIGRMKVFDFIKKYQVNFLRRTTIKDFIVQRPERLEHLYQKVVKGMAKEFNMPPIDPKSEVLPPEFMAEVDKRKDMGIDIILQIIAEVDKRKDMGIDEISQIF
jgi:hypothetical protein